MNYRPVLFVSLIVLPSIFSVCFAHQDSVASEAANVVPEIQKSSESGTINAVKKPSEAEAIEAAVKYLNSDGQSTIEKTEFIAWGTYSEQKAYWPMKFRMSYKLRGSDILRHNEYAVKISKDNKGKWKAEQYYAWRTDFK